ncbi:hypothetical protein J2S10_004616 [Neobacillus ginsengisoli]|uniref:Uncharacterized protein n=1 Tax=Neobacillus ginsengisoli TaxID=904295 RepID=A0ABT9Y0Q0_9BACI|nr:hypothetical protein [Neobacillus ginsengisoli]
MENKIETVYILENPEKKIIKFATGTQLAYENIIKDVFGVACVKDLQLMIQFNKSFQDSICHKHGIRENKITIDKILRIASKQEILLLKNQLIENNDKPLEKDFSVPRPFERFIKLQEGIFKWDEKNSSYNSVNLGA